MTTPDYSFSITVFPAVPEKAGRRPPPTITTNRRRSPSRVLQLLAGHCPSEILDRAALGIIDYAYTALLKIAPPEGSQSVVEVSAPVDPADPYSPPVHVDASSTHCLIRQPYSRRPLAVPEDGRTCVVEQIKNHPGASPSRRASVSVSPAAVHLQDHCRVVVVGAGEPKVRWRFVDARPDASSEALLRVLRTIGSLLEQAISRETTLMLRASGFGRSPKVDGIVTARTALEEMRGVLDVDAMIAHRRRQKRGRADAEMLTDMMRTLHVGEVQDDAEVLAKKLRDIARVTCMHIQGRSIPEGRSLQSAKYLEMQQPWPPSTDETTKP